MSKVLSVEAMDDLFIDIFERLSNKEALLKMLISINRNGRIEELLELLGLSSLLKPKYNYSPYKNGKILVVGQSEVGEDKLLMTAQKLGIDKNRVMLHLDYNDAKTFNYEKTKWDPNYSLIIVGPQGHSSISKEDYSSAIARMEQEEGFPPVIRASRDGSLKSISKSMFKDSLTKAIKNGWIEKNYNS